MKSEKKREDEQKNGEIGGDEGGKGGEDWEKKRKGENEKNDEGRAKWKEKR